MTEQPQQPWGAPAEPERSDLAADLAGAKGGLSRVTKVLLGLVVVAAAFVGGIVTHSAVADDSASATGQQRRSFPNGSYGGPGPGPGAGGQRGTIGTVSRVDGSTVYVTTPDGKEVAVTTTGDTTVRLTTEGKVSDLKQGQSVVVQGETGADGSVSAKTISEQPMVLQQPRG